MPETEKPFHEGLAKIPSVTGEIRRRRDKFIYETIKKTRLKEYEDDGWEVARENVNTYRMKKPKTHDVLFEDRVWALFARLGFEQMNKDRNFRIKYAKDRGIPGKQIDVFAADSEVVILVECKSAETKKRTSFSMEIAEIGSIKEPISNTIKNHFYPKKPKIAWIFATNNYIVSKSDELRLDENDLLYFSQDDIKYYEDLVDLLGSVARYQLFGSILKNQSILGLNYSTPAIKGNVGGFTTYSFSVEPEVLLKIGFVLHRTDASMQAFDSYQRMVKKPRIKEIEKYINGGGFFPNSVIINFNSRRPLKFDEVKTCEHCSQSDLGILHLPNQYHSAFIIDGQHRLYGYGNTECKSQNTIPVVAFEKLPEEEQTRTFVDINNKQKSVSKSLLMTLMGEFNWGSDNHDEALAAVKTRLIDHLNNKNDSPLYKRIKLLDEKGSQKRCLTKNYLIGQALNKTNFFGITQKKKIVKTGYLWAGDYDRTLEKSYEFLNTCFQFFEMGVAEQWENGSSEGGFITMNLGISSLIRVFDDLLEYLEKDHRIDFTKLTGEEIGGKLKPYLDPVISFVDSLSLEEIKKLRSFVGGGAVDRVLREFQNIINKEFDSFSPEGLTQWQKESTGMYNDASRKLGDDMQLRIRAYVFDNLKNEYGISDDRWWLEGIPKDIQKKCAVEKIEHGEGSEQDYLYLIDYQKIIKYQKKILLNSFTSPDLKSASVDKRLNWFARWNKIRAKYSHPEKGKVSEEEYKFMLGLQEWLYKNI
ncbi:MAG: DGQHR domain-containing protein [Desulfobacterales bacterium]